MYQVAYSSHIAPEDWARVTPAIVELDCGLMWTSPDDFGTKLAKADLAIFRYNAYNNVEMIHELSPKNAEYFLRDSLVRACWSEDSHHVWDMEAALLPLFQHMFVAHSEYLSAFPKNMTHWIPTSFNSFSLDQVFDKTTAKNNSPKRDLIFPFRKYPDGLTSRNKIADQISTICDQRSLIHLFGEVGLETGKQQEATTCNEILNSFGVLNVSLRQELNQRFFTAHALNKPLLCDFPKDVENVDLDLTSTIYFERDLSDFEARLDEFLNIDAEKVATRDQVLMRHMHLHRLVEMINTSLNLDLKVDIPELDFCEKPKSIVRNGGADVIPYPSFSGLDTVETIKHKGLYGLYRAYRDRVKRRKVEKTYVYHPKNIRRSVEQFLQRA